NLIIALGVGVGEVLDIEKIRYHRVVIMTDADVDGQHIRTLLLTLFFRYLRPVIEQGYVYVAQPPLYKVQQGKKVAYAYTEEQKEQIMSQFDTSMKISTQRYKGLGEMNPEQLWETTMDPEVRTMYRIQITDAEEADRVFEMLMGGEVAPRKKFIQAHAKKVKNLDI
ncbi:MAG TPA: toprim domain-containing protein, partial [Candidatus Gracilibacteria bacterium]|nr:toprim domain-containing protein [Candidatus Gracilibacteria bacterium]